MNSKQLNKTNPFETTIKDGFAINTQTQDVVTINNKQYIDKTSFDNLKNEYIKTVEFMAFGWQSDTDALVSLEESVDLQATKHAQQFATIICVLIVLLVLTNLVGIGTILIALIKLMTNNATSTIICVVTCVVSFVAGIYTKHN